MGKRGYKGKLLVFDEDCSNVTEGTNVSRRNKLGSTRTNNNGNITATTAGTAVTTRYQDNSSGNEENLLGKIPSSANNDNELKVLKVLQIVEMERLSLQEKVRSQNEKICELLAKNETLKSKKGRYKVAIIQKDEIIRQLQEQLSQFEVSEFDESGQWGTSKINHQAMMMQKRREEKFMKKIKELVSHNENLQNMVNSTENENGFLRQEVEKYKMTINFQLKHFSMVIDSMRQQFKGSPHHQQNTIPSEVNLLSDIELFTSTDLQTPVVPQRQMKKGGQQHMKLKSCDFGPNFLKGLVNAELNSKDDLDLPVYPINNNAMKESRRSKPGPRGLVYKSNNFGGYNGDEVNFPRRFS